MLANYFCWANNSEHEHELKNISNADKSTCEGYFYTALCYAEKTDDLRINSAFVLPLIDLFWVRWGIIGFKGASQARPV